LVDCIKNKKNLNEIDYHLLVAAFELDIIIRDKDDPKKMEIIQRGKGRLLNLILSTLIRLLATYNSYNDDENYHKYEGIKQGTITMDLAINILKRAPKNFPEIPNINIED